jgi:hypothetical protein
MTRGPVFSYLLTTCVVAAGLVLTGASSPELSGISSVHSPRLVKHSINNAPMPAQCRADGSACLRTLEMADGAAQVQAYSNFPLTGSARPTHAIVVIEGGGRDAKFTFTGMMQAAQKSGVADSTMVIAPWFKTAKDNPGAKEARWTNGGWKIGDPAQGPSPLSSFTVVDQLLATLATKSRFPRLAWSTLTGHSSGGQFTDRYASFSRVPSALPKMLVTYIVANPSSFLYFDNERPVGPDGAFAVPNTSSCPNYNTYKYGMQSRNNYTLNVSPSDAERMFLARRVTILNGSADDFQNGDMDATCGGNLQGATRVVRGANFFARMHRIAPGAPHDRIVVPGVDHDHLALYDSAEASTVLFGPGHSTTAEAQ